MYLYGHPGKPYGYGVYGGIDDVEWCACDTVFIGTFEDVQEAPISPCPEDV